MTRKHTGDIASYATIASYSPKFADFVVWSGLFRVRYGFVNNYDSSSQMVSVIFETTPRLLLTLNDEEISQSTKLVSLNDIRNNRKGRWYIQQVTNGQTVWHI